MPEIYESCHSWTGLSNKTTLHEVRELLSERASNQTFGSVPQQQNSAEIINPWLSSPCVHYHRAQQGTRGTNCLQKICPFNINFLQPGDKGNPQLFFSGFKQKISTFIVGFLQLLDHPLLQENRTQLYSLASLVRSLLWHISIVLFLDQGTKAASFPAFKRAHHPFCCSTGTAWFTS